MLLGDHAPIAVERDAFVDLDAEIAGAGAARLQRVQQFRVGGDAGAAADQLDGRALVDIGLPADLPQERRGEEARHRAADDDGARAAAFARHSGAQCPFNRAAWFSIRSACRALW